MQTLIEPTEQVNQTNWQNEDDYDSTKIRICMIIIVRDEFPACVSKEGDRAGAGECSWMYT